MLERYLVEVVERYALCPWARTTYEGGELAVGILWGQPSLEVWVAEGRRLLAAPAIRVAIAVAPELAISRAELSTLRDRVAAELPSAGVAEFHPSAALDLATPARLVPFLRRSPDPLLQFVPLAVLDAVRGVARAALAAGRAQQARMLAGRAAPGRSEISERIAADNHATVVRAQDEIAAVLDDIAADRDAGYARVGITSSR